ncbi:hypothetical protein X946_3832 [Burkholderia sp. ABCPW 111]|nr:hypothetical protein X946_3832 [Burkholderia sp. ABCPW 111]
MGWQFDYLPSRVILLFGALQFQVFFYGASSYLKNTLLRPHLFRRIPPHLITSHI